MSFIGVNKMYIERLDENKIKVTLCGDDIKMWNVDLKNFSENTAEAQDMFWYALKKAEQDVNFKVNQDSQLIVETTIEGDDGFVMYISRIDNETELADALVKAGKRAKQSEFKSRHKGRMYPLLRIFKFSDFEDLCCGIKEIHELYIGKSRLLKYMGNFYLELLPQDNFGNFEMDNILSEFGEKAKRPLMLQGVLNEHGKLMIATDAVNIIATNFV